MSDSKKDDKRLMLGALVILCAILIGGGYYWFVLAPGEQVQKQDGVSAFDKKIANDPSAKEMFGAFEKQKEFGTNYYAVYNETLPGGSEQQVKLYKTPELEMVSVENEIFTQAAYWKDGEVYFCQSDFEKKMNCAKVSQGATYDTAVGLRQLFIGFDPNAKTETEKLYRMGVINFSGEPQKRTVAGRTCTMVEYDISYSHLNEFQLSELGISKDDPMLTVFENFKTKRCFDDVFGLTIFRILEYNTVFDKSKSYHKVEYDTLQTPVREKIELAPEESDEEKMLPLMEQMSSFAKFIDECIVDEGNLSKCVLMSAIKDENVRMCNLIGDEGLRDDCALRIVLTKNQPDLCEQTGKLRNECYLNYAYINNDESYCSVIDDVEVKEKCLDAIVNKDKILDEEEIN